MDVSIIVPTYNGAKKLPNILTSLINQTFTSFEVIVVVDGSTDNTLEVLLPYKAFFSNFHIIIQENRGRAAVRNSGANVAQGKLLIFFDDDMRPLPTCVQEHINFHNKIATGILLGGAQLEEESAMKTDIQVYKAFLSRKWFEPYKSIDRPLGDNNLFLSAANFSVPKDLFWLLNGFDERLTDAEDFELAKRALRNNIPVFFNYEAIAWHDDFITAKSYVKRQIEYKVANSLLAKYSGIDDNSIEKKPNSFLKSIFYKFFSSYKWVKCIDSEIFIFIPKKIRFKLYDVIIHAVSSK